MRGPRNVQRYAIDGTTKRAGRNRDRPVVFVIEQISPG